MVQTRKEKKSVLCTLILLWQLTAIEMKGLHSENWEGSGSQMWWYKGPGSGTPGCSTGSYKPGEVADQLAPLAPSVTEKQEDEEALQTKARQGFWAGALEQSISLTKMGSKFFEKYAFVCGPATGMFGAIASEYSDKNTLTPNQIMARVDSAIAKLSSRIDNQMTAMRTIIDEKIQARRTADNSKILHKYTEEWMKCPIKVIEGDKDGLIKCHYNIIERLNLDKRTFWTVSLWNRILNRAPLKGQLWKITLWNVRLLELEMVPFREMVDMAVTQMFDMVLEIYLRVKTSWAELSPETIKNFKIWINYVKVLILTDSNGCVMDFIKFAKGFKEVILTHWATKEDIKLKETVTKKWQLPCTTDEEVTCDKDFEGETTYIDFGSFRTFCESMYYTCRCPSIGMGSVQNCEIKFRRRCDDKANEDNYDYGGKGGTTGSGWTRKEANRETMKSVKSRAKYLFTIRRNTYADKHRNAVTKYINAELSPFIPQWEEGVTFILEKIEEVKTMMKAKKAKKE